MSKPYFGRWVREDLRDLIAHDPEFIAREAKRGVPCPRCNGIEFKTNQYGEYVVTDSSQ